MIALKLRLNVDRTIEVARKFLDPDYTLIYQMGKVGSSSLHKSLPKSIQIHSLYGKSPCTIRHRLFPAQYFKRILVDVLKRFLIRRRKTINIITVVRDLNDRDVSMFFQDLPLWLLDTVKSKNTKEPWDADMNFLLDSYKNSFDHMYGMHWFDTEFRKFSNIDIFKYPFSKSEGFALISEGKFRILILLADKIDSSAAIVEKFVGEKITLLRSNESGDKWYASVYREFKSRLSSLEEIKALKKQSKIMKHFFGTDIPPK